MAPPVNASPFTEIQELIHRIENGFDDSSPELQIELGKIFFAEISKKFKISESQFLAISDPDWDDLRSKISTIKAKVKVALPLAKLNKEAEEIEETLDLKQIASLRKRVQEFVKYHPVMNRGCHTAIDRLKNRLTGLCEQSIFKKEHRIVEDETLVLESLEKWMKRAKKQMEEENPQSFLIVAAPDNWESEEIRVGNFNVGIAHAKGRRTTMEDEHLATVFDIKIGEKIYPIQLFGIFDGHGGKQAAEFLRDHLSQKIQETLLEFNPNGLNITGIWNSLKLACVRLDEDFKRTCSNSIFAGYQGSTATIAMILDDVLWTANVGDSRTILNNHGTPVRLTYDAKPDDLHFSPGISDRGGHVTPATFYEPARLQGISMARAFGDVDLKGVMSARPKITRLPLSEIKETSHLILACDGVFDVARTADIAKSIHVLKNVPLAILAKDIIYSSYNASSGDNLSVLVVKIK